MERVRHKKRGTTYEVLGEGEVRIGLRPDPIEAGLSNRRLVSEGDKFVIYRSERDGKLWARLPEEFHGGRFEPVE